MVAGGVGPRAATARPASTQWGDGEMSKGDFNGFNMDLARVSQPTDFSNRSWDPTKKNRNGSTTWFR